MKYSASTFALSVWIQLIATSQENGRALFPPLLELYRLPLLDYSYPLIEDWGDK